MSLTRPDPVLGGRFELGQLPLAGGIHIGWSARDGGDGGDPLVLIPGSFDDRSVFGPLIGQLGERVPLCIVELPGHGRSWPPDAAGSIERFAEQVSAVIEVVYAAAGVFIGGHSIGGMVAIEAARSTAHCLLGVISLEGWTNHHAARDAFAGDMISTLSDAQQAARDARRAAVTRRWSERQIDQFRTIWRTWDGTALLAATPLPVLEVYGDRGRAAPTRSQLHLPQRDNLQLVTIQGASHYVHVERPAEVAAACSRFAARHRRC